MAKAATSRAKGKTTTSRAKSTKTRARSTTTRKTSANLRESAEAAQPSEELTVVTEATTDADDSVETLDVVDDALRKRDLIEAVVARSGVKKRDAKPAIEATLAILGETLQGGRGLNIPEFGKLKIQNSKKVEEASIINMRLRRKAKVASETEE
ncbi:HU family DNA-binding protein [Shimia sp. NS0008-38b]|uniref:HU family DNA-binding protein n=1 Tax=Shimia sp. NS0008-38b TaxID=3127653 RepID=UPI0033414E02